MDPLIEERGPIRRLWNRVAEKGAPAVIGGTLAVAAVAGGVGLGINDYLHTTPEETRAAAAKAQARKLEQAKEKAAEAKRQAETARKEKAAAALKAKAERAAAARLAREEAAHDAANAPGAPECKNVQDTVTHLEQSVARDGFEGYKEYRVRQITNPKALFFQPNGSTKATQDVVVTFNMKGRYEEVETHQVYYRVASDNNGQCEWKPVASLEELSR